MGELGEARVLLGDDAHDDRVGEDEPEAAEPVPRIRTVAQTRVSFGI